MIKNSFVAEVTFNDIMDLHMSSRGTIVLERPFCVFYATKCNTHKQSGTKCNTNKDKQHTQQLIN